MVVLLYIDPDLKVAETAEDLNWLRHMYKYDHLAFEKDLLSSRNADCIGPRFKDILPVLYP